MSLCYRIRLSPGEVCLDRLLNARRHHVCKPLCMLEQVTYRTAIFAPADGGGGDAEGVAAQGQGLFQGDG